MQDNFIEVRKGVRKDHHFVNLEGYLIAYSHLFPRNTPRSDNKSRFGVTPEEMLFIIHLCAFDFQGTNDAYPSLGTIAELMGVSLRSVHNYKNRCEAAGLLVITSGAKQGERNVYDFSPIFLFCQTCADNDGWFYRTTLKGGGMQDLAQGGMQDLAQGGMQDLAHKDKESKIKNSNTPLDGEAVARTKVKRKSDEWKAIESTVKRDIYGVDSIGYMGGTLCDYLWIRGATSDSIAAFAKWYYQQGNKTMVWEISREAKTDNFNGKFCIWWQKFEKQYQAPALSPKVITIQMPDGALFQLDPSNPQIQVLLDKGGEVLS